MQGRFGGTPTADSRIAVPCLSDRNTLRNPPRQHVPTVCIHSAQEKLSKTQIILTLILGQLFGWIGILLNDRFGGLIFPFLFGISIPLANWNSVRYVKWRAMLTLGLISIALFFGTAALTLVMGNIHLYLSFFTVGLSGVGFLLFNSAFISSIRMNTITGTITFILVSISFPIGRELLDLNSDHLFLFSTFMTTLGLCASRLRPERKN